MLALGDLGLFGMRELQLLVDGVDDAQPDPDQLVVLVRAHVEAHRCEEA